MTILHGLLLYRARRGILLYKTCAGEPIGLDGYTQSGTLLSTFSIVAPICGRSYTEQCAEATYLTSRDSEWELLGGSNTHFGSVIFKVVDSNT
jgi:hypothetical protein